MSGREIHHHHGGATALVAGLGIGAWLALRDQTENRHPAAAPKPAPAHTVIIHSVTHTVTRVAQSPGLPPWAVVIIAVVALGVLCAVFTSRRPA